MTPAEALAVARRAVGGPDMPPAVSRTNGRTWWIVPSWPAPMASAPGVLVDDATGAAVVTTAPLDPETRATIDAMQDVTP